MIVQVMQSRWCRVGTGTEMQVPAASQVLSECWVVGADVVVKRSWCSSIG